MCDPAAPGPVPPGWQAAILSGGQAQDAGRSNHRRQTRQPVVRELRCGVQVNQPKQPPRLEDYYQPKTPEERAGLAAAYAMRDYRRSLRRNDGRVIAKIDGMEEREKLRRRLSADDVRHGGNRRQSRCRPPTRIRPKFRVPVRS